MRERERLCTCIYVCVSIKSIRTGMEQVEHVTDMTRLIKHKQHRKWQNYKQETGNDKTTDKKQGMTKLQTRNRKWQNYKHKGKTFFNTCTMHLLTFFAAVTPYWNTLRPSLVNSDINTLTTKIHVLLICMSKFCSVTYTIFVSIIFEEHFQKTRAVKSRQSQALTTKHL